MRNHEPSDPGRRQQAVSITTGFILNFGIATIAVSIVLFTMQGFYTDLADDARETELHVAGERVVWELEKTDRIAQEGPDTDSMMYFSSDEIDQSYTFTVYEDNVTLYSGSNMVTVSHTADIQGAPYDLTGGQNHFVEYDEDGIQEIS